jgi:exodeoxyribonuclease V gamma subunit
VLHLHRAERADVLAGALGGLLGQPSADPFTPEIISVPSRGVERWLTQQLSLVLGASGGGGDDGVCANVSFPAPGRLIAEAVAAVSGIDPRTDPWRPGRSVWPLLELIDAEPELLEIAPERGEAAALGPGRPAPGVRRSHEYAAARHLAQLFDSYATFRPAMIRDWAAGADVAGGGAALPDDVCWQPRLWRRLRQSLAVPSSAERLDPAAAALLASPESVDLPERVSLFGLTRLPPGQLPILAALAAHREVHLWLLHPSPVLWERVRSSGQCRRVRRHTDGTRELARHPLLSSLGRDAREMQLTLAAVGSPAPATDTHHPLPAAPSASALAVLQRAIREDVPPDQGPPAPLDRADRSIQIHACHGRARQVEVLRDVILGLLVDDPSLEPRDVLVMCPDIETFAPLISATFGAASVAASTVPGDPEGPEASRSPASQLRVRLADRSLRQTNPVMSVATTLLQLADGRMTASEVLDLAATAPVRRRFGFDDDDLGRLTEWVTQAQVRWGLDAAHRADFQLEQYRQNTWEAGLDRLLLGVAMAEGPAGGDARAQPAGPGWVGLALPLDDVDSTDIELVGLLAELVQRLRVAVDRLRGPQSVAAWIAALAETVEAVTATSPAEIWQSAQLRSELTAVLEGAGERAERVELTLADVRHLLADRLQGRPTRANFRTGSLTMCTLVPMRSVPHRVVCLLGLDDGAFPRQPAVDGDDILRRDPITGERDERSEDRQLLLDAILSTGNHLVIMYTGADERTNARRPPAVPVGELLDALDTAFVAAGGRQVRDQITTRHPLQPFDPANFTLGAVGDRPFSFDRSALGGARSMSSPRCPPPPFLPAPLDPAPAGDLELETLRMFLEGPVKGFLRQRLEVTLPRREDEASDELSIELDGLGRWGVGQRMLDARLSGVDPANCRQAEWRRGTLPPGALGARILRDVATDVEQVVTDVADVRIGEPRGLDLAVLLAGERRLTGTVSGIYATTLVTVDFGRINPKRRLRAWLAYLLLAAAHPREQFTALAVGGRSRCELGPIDATEARAWLSDLVDLHAAGLREPLPIAVDTSFEYAQARRRGAVPEEALKKAARCWAGSRFGGESRQPEHERVFGLAAPLQALTGEPPTAGDGAGDWPDEPTRFGVLSRRWWDPLLEAESRAAG